MVGRSLRPSLHHGRKFTPALFRGRQGDEGSNISLASTIWGDSVFGRSFSVIWNRAKRQDTPVAAGFEMAGLEIRRQALDHAGGRLAA